MDMLKIEKLTMECVDGNDDSCDRVLGEHFIGTVAIHFKELKRVTKDSITNYSKK